MSDEGLLQRLGIQPETLRELQELTPREQQAFALVWLAHTGHGYDLGKPSNKNVAIGWWSDFLPARIKVAARTCGSLGEFMDALAGRLRGQVGGKGEEGESHREVYLSLKTVPAQAQAEMLDILEREAISLTTLVRADMDERKKKKGKQHGKATNDCDTGHDHDFGGERAAEPEPRRESEPDLFSAVALGSEVVPADEGPPTGAGPLLRGLVGAADAASAQRW